MLLDDGSSTRLPLSADAFFDATSPFIVAGAGSQVPNALGATVLPSLARYQSLRALRYDRLGTRWHIARIFAEDGDQDSDALELTLDGGGSYAQFLCSSAANLPRPDVLGEYLRDRFGRSKLTSAGAATLRR